MGAKILSFDDGFAVLDERCENCKHLYYDELDWKFPMCKKGKCPFDDEPTVDPNKENDNGLEAIS